jgi:hypothetical protein
MRKYEKRISELDMEGKSLSKTIKGLIKEFTEGETELRNLKKALEEAQDDDEVTKINADIDELESALDEADDQLVHKLNIWHRNYDVYRQNAQQHLQKGGRGKKKDPDGSQVEPINPPAPAPAPAPAPEPAPLAATGTAASTGIITKSGGGETQVSTQAVVIEDEKKEEGGWFTTIALGALAIGGILIGVNLYKNRK